MSIDPFDPELISLEQARKRCPQSPCNHTMWRWASKGVRGVKLEVIRISNAYFTTPEKLREFFERQQDTPAAAKTKPTSKRKRRVLRSKRRLSKAGI